jgi:F-type H+-transporting ATPase subunit delta
MKISAKKYAQILYSSLEKEPKNAKEILAGFAALLSQNNDFSKEKKIIDEFRKIWNREKGIIEAEVITSGEIGKSALSNINKFILELSGAKEISVSHKEEPGILGGAVIKFGDKIIDASLKTKLFELKQKISS